MDNELRAIDRCDRCGAQAYVRATLMNGELLFCAHHFKKVEESIAKASITIHDERHRLKEKEPVLS